MSGAEAFALLTRLHGQLAVLGLALLVHPLVTLRRRRGLGPGTRLSAELAAAALLLVTILGWLLYPTYRRQVKPGLVQEALPLALGFETKEHLAFLAMALALGAAATLRLAGGLPEARRAAWWLLLAALGCGLAAGGLGVRIAAGAHPAW